MDQETHRFNDWTSQLVTDAGHWLHVSIHSYLMHKLELLAQLVTAAVRALRLANSLGTQRLCIVIYNSPSIQFLLNLYESGVDLF